jgi:hypothetical protein
MKTYTIPAGNHYPSPRPWPCPRTRRPVRVAFTLDTRAGSIETPDRAWSKLPGWRLPGGPGIRIGFAQWGQTMRFCVYQTIAQAPGWLAHPLVTVPATGLIEGRYTIHPDGLVELALDGLVHRHQTAAKMPRLHLTTGPYFGGSMYAAPAEIKITIR